MRRALRSLGRRLVPESVRADRASRYGQRVREEWGVPEIARRYLDAFGTAVRSGPFAGLRYPEDLVAEVDAPVAKLWGTYELEIADAFAAAIARRPACFVDIGCAEGYYAVGFARACPQTEVHVFDLSSIARSRCRRLAELNGVTDRIRVARRFNVAVARGLPLAGALLLSDIEGAERWLFDEPLVSLLGRAHVVMEVHPRSGSDDLTDTVAGRFERSHEVEEVRVAPRRVEEHPQLLQVLAEDATELALAEARHPDNHWLIARPRAE